MSVEDKIIYQYGDTNANPRFEAAEFVASWVIKKMYLKRKAIKKKRITTIVTPVKLFNGDIFYTRNSPTKYYVVKWDGYYATGGHIQRIARVDGGLITSIDLENLQNKTWIQIKGYVTSCKC